MQTFENSPNAPGVYLTNNTKILFVFVFVFSFLFVFVFDAFGAWWEGECLQTFENSHECTRRESQIVNSPQFFFSQFVQRVKSVDAFR